MPGRCQADMEADWGLMGSTMACGASPFHQAPCPTEREDDHGSSLWGSRHEAVASSVTCCWGLGRRSWPLGQAVCRARGGLLNWSPGEPPLHAATPLHAAATEEGDHH